jgi:hypothetical protein
MPISRTRSQPAHRHVQLACSLSNPHSSVVITNRSATARGFLPWGLCDACPLGSVASDSSAREGRHRTTLNIAAGHLFGKQTLHEAEEN